CRMLDLWRRGRSRSRHLRGRCVRRRSRRSYISLPADTNQKSALGLRDLDFVRIRQRNLESRHVSTVRALIGEYAVRLDAREIQTLLFVLELARRDTGHVDQQQVVGRTVLIVCEGAVRMQRDYCCVALCGSADVAQLRT